MPNQKITIPLKHFLLTEEQCPETWKEFNLYLFRDENLVFYVGQSQSAFARAWEHLLNGFHGHSIVGRFVWNNWPRSMRFSIELMNSDSEEFAIVGNDLNAAERMLIERYSPCFNVSLNNQPTPLPDTYFPPNARLRSRSSLGTLIHQAARAVQADENRKLLEELETGN